MDKTYSSPIKLSKDIINAIQGKYVIIIVGFQRMGKTTESCEIVKHLNKKAVVIVEEEGHKPDELLHNIYNIKRIIASKEKIKSATKKLYDCTLIYDDFASAGDRQQRNIRKLSNHCGKRNLTLILIYHGREIPSSYLYMGNNFLIVKHQAKLHRNKFAQYFDINGISIDAENYCNNKIKKFDSVYIQKDGVYYHRDGATNKIIKGEFKHKGIKIIDIKQLKKLALQGKSHKKIAQELKVSESKIYSEIKVLKEKDPVFKKSYTESKKRKGVSKKGKIGYKKKSGITLSVISENTYANQKKNVRKIAQINGLKNIGDYAVEIIGKGIYNAFERVIEKNLVEYVDILVRKGTGGADVTIELKNKIIETESNR